MTTTGGSAEMPAPVKAIDMLKMPQAAFEMEVMRVAILLAFEGPVETGVSKTGQIADRMQNEWHHSEDSPDWPKLWHRVHRVLRRRAPSLVTPEQWKHK